MERQSLLGVLTTTAPEEWPPVNDAPLKLQGIPETPIERDPWNWVLSICLFITAIITLLGNGLVLATFFKEKILLKSHFNIFLINLTVTDIAISVTAIPLYGINYFYGMWPQALGPHLCAVWVFCDWGMTFASVYTLMAISVDRYLAVCWSHQYRNMNTRKRALLMVLGIWLAVLLIWLPAFIYDQVTHEHIGSVCMWSIEHNGNFSIFMAVAGYHIPTLVIVFCYIRLGVAIRQPRVHRTKFDNNKGHANERHRQTNSGITLDSATSGSDHVVVLSNMASNRNNTESDFDSCTETETAFSNDFVNGNSETEAIHFSSDDAAVTTNLYSEATSRTINGVNCSTDSKLGVTQVTRKSSLSLDIPYKNHRLPEAFKLRPRSFTYGTVMDQVTSRTKKEQNTSLDGRTSSGTPGKEMRLSNTLRMSRQRRDYRLFVRISYIIVTYLILWLPFHVVFDLLLAGVPVPDHWYTVATLMCYLNSTINPLLYALGNPKMKEAFKKTLYCRK